MRIGGWSCAVSLLVCALPVVQPACADSDQNSAVNHPAKFAWQLFVDISKPAGNGTNDAVWETWADQNLLYGDPNTKPTWPAPTHKLKVLHPSVQEELLRQESLNRRTSEAQVLKQQGMGSSALVPEFIPDNPLRQEVRLNKPAFDFVVDNNLWYLQGQTARFASGQAVVFPLEAREIKAHWKQITAADKPRYHWQTGSDGKIYGLVALHLISKDLPNWTWATFEQVDNPERCKVLACSDDFGVSADGKASPELKALFKAAGMGTEWESYRLDGAQVDFADSTGRPTLLGNSLIEGPFMSTSSCITCHARSSVNGAGQRLSVFDQGGQSHNGTPVPDWFWANTPGGQKMKYMQLDFVWSLRFAQPRTTP